MPRALATSATNNSTVYLAATPEVFFCYSSCAATESLVSKGE